ILRLAFIDARRPARNVAGNPLAAIENVELLDAGFPVLGVSCGKRQHQRQQRDGQTGCKPHELPPRWRFLVLSYLKWKISSGAILSIRTRIRTKLDLDRDVAQARQVAQPLLVDRRLPGRI